MRLALVLLVAALVGLPLSAQQRPGPTPLPEGVARGGLAARAGDIPIDRKVKAEMKENAPPRSRVPVLKGGRMRPLLSPPSPTPRRKAAPKSP